MTIDKSIQTKVDKPIKTSKKDYKVLDKIATKAEVKDRKSDIGGDFYIFDLYDTEGKRLALNRYVFKDSNEQPFETLTEEDELILNPPVVESEMEMI